jgi:hypothetical protein
MLENLEFPGLKYPLNLLSVPAEGRWLFLGVSVGMAIDEGSIVGDWDRVALELYDDSEGGGRLRVPLSGCCPG